ncbi:hypothetical protein N0V88_001931 [Collariella sp. IMI 366227]|nr:hypothetical protein N0V88_001931 [Collariella sp. IMI 366227]
MRLTQTAVQDPKDIIVKIQATALCGSELHVFRGHQPSEAGFIMGHEFVGEIVQAGSDVKTVALGDKVVAPFTVSCGTCWYCLHSSSSRCSQVLLFGCPALDGGQAEYVRIPFADGTVVRAPSTINDRALILMADIFPTGFFGARNAFGMLMESQKLPSEEAVVVVVGCGPVGLCAIIPWSGSEAYGKNLKIQMGRCPVRSIFPEALEVLAKNQDKFSFMFDKIMPLSDAVEGYDLFDQMKVQKVIFKP